MFQERFRRFERAAEAVNDPRLFRSILFFDADDFLPAADRVDNDREVEAVCKLNLRNENFLLDFMRDKRKLVKSALADCNDRSGVFRQYVLHDFEVALQKLGVDVFGMNTDGEMCGEFLHFARDIGEDVLNPHDIRVIGDE